MRKKRAEDKKTRKWIEAKTANPKTCKCGEMLEKALSLMKEAESMMQKAR